MREAPSLPSPRPAAVRMALPDGAATACGGTRVDGNEDCGEAAGANDAPTARVGNSPHRTNAYQASQPPREKVTGVGDREGKVPPTPDLIR